MTYDVLTWDAELQKFTPQEGMESPSLNISLAGVRRALRELQQKFGYSCHRTVHDSDAAVLVERNEWHCFMCDAKHKRYTVTR